MTIQSKLSRHWTDDEIIAHLYGVGPEDGHLRHCSECQSRLSVFKKRRETQRPSEDVSFEQLTVQRRQIYTRLSERAHGRLHFQWRRWASAAAVLFLLSGSVIYYEERQQQQAANRMLSDAQLARDVSRMSENPEAQPTGPLQALFEE